MKHTKRYTKYDIRYMILSLISYLLSPTFQHGFIKFSRKGISTLLISAVLITGTGILYLFNPFTEKSDAAWWDDTWIYRQRVDITSINAAQTDFQIGFVIDTSTLVTAGKIQSDCDDIRVTDANGKLLPHWVEESNPGCNQSTTKVWTKLPTLSTHGGSIYVYYGNPSVANAEKPQSVFVFFDNFSGSLGSWTNPVGCAGTISSGVLQISSSTGCDSTPMYVTSLALSDNSGYYFEYRGKFSSGGSGRLQSYQRYRATNGHLARLWINGTSTNYQEYDGSWGSESDIGNSGMSADTWYNLSTRVSEGNNAWAVNGTSIANPSSTSSLRNHTDLTVGLGEYQTTVQYDNVRVRKGGIIPTVSSATSEEKGTAPIGYWKFDEGNGALANNSQFKSNSTMTNMMTNPTFESNTSTGWTTIGSQYTLSTEKAAFGTYSVKFSGTNQNGSLDGPCIVVSASTAYTWSLFAYKVSSGASGNFTIDLFEYTGSTCSSGNVDGGNTSIPVSDRWTRMSGTVTTHGSTGSVRVRLVNDGNSTGTAYYDGIQLETGSIANNYCDGTLTGNGTHAWTGSANASSSTCSKGTDGMLTNGPAWTSDDQCVSGKCLYFDGSNDYVNLGGSSEYSQNISDLSVGAWVRLGRSLGSNSTNYEIVSNESYPNTGWLFRIEDTTSPSTAGQIHFRFSSGSATYVTSSAQTFPNDLKWHYVVGTKTGTTGKIYVDGIEVSGYSASVSLTAPSTATVGTYIGGNSQLFLGYMDELKIYNYGLTAAQVKANYNARGGVEAASSILGSNTQNMPAALSSGLLGYWKMDESSGNATDSGPLGNTLTNTNTATYTAGKFGNAGTLSSASSQYFTCTDANCGGTGELDPASTGFTAGAWIKKADVTQNYAMIITKSAGGGSSGDGYELRFAGTGGQIQFVGYIGGSFRSISGSTVLSNNTWTHVAVTYDGSFLRLFVNGVSDATPVAVTGSMVNVTSDFRIGARTDGYHFTGSIDEARVYNRALNPSEMLQLYNWAPGPVGYWSLEEGSGTSASDTSGNGQAGILTNGPLWTSGKYGKGVALDGTDDYINVTTTATLRPSTVTAAAWVNSNTSTWDDTGWIISHRTDTSGNGYIIHPNSGSTSINVYIGISSSWHSVNYSPSSIQGWHHYALTYDGETLLFYIDGALVGSNTTPTGSITYTGTPLDLTIGRDTGQSRYGNGQMDDVKIYSYARTQKQITEDMNASHPAPGSPVGSPIGYWKMDEGADNTCSGGTNDACNSGSAGSALDLPQTSLAVPATADSGWTQEGKFGRALRFDGSGDRLSLSDTSTLDFTDTEDFTLCGWFYRDTFTTEDRIVGKRNGNGGIDTGYSVWIDASNDKLNFEVSDGTDEYSVTSATAFTATGWNHFCAVWDEDSAANTEIYINGIDNNGTDSGTIANVGSLANSINFVIGARADSDDYFDGGLDEIKIFNTALTEAQAKIDYNRAQAQVMGATSDKSTYEKQAANQEYCVPGDTTSCAAPTGRWDFEEGSGTSAFDKSGGGYTGTISEATYVPGKIGKALKFDGVDDSVDTNTASSNFITNSAGTVEAWVYPTGSAVSNANVYGLPTVVSDYCCGGGYWGIYRGNYTGSDLNNGTGDGIYIFNYDGDVDYVKVSYTANEWVHIAWVHSGGVLYAYKNGMLVGTDTSGNTGALTDELRIGDSGTNTAIGGSIDNVRTYNYARSAAQINWDYSKGAPRSHLKLDECQGTSAGDSSGLSNTGTINIGASGTYTLAGTCSSGTATHAWAGGAAGVGKRNYALSFDGTNDYINFASSLGTPPSVFSYSMWVYRTGTNDCIMQVLDSSTIASGYNFCSFALDGSTLYAAMWTGSMTSTSLGTLTADTWYHIAQTYDGTTLKGYVNGVLVNSTTGTYSPPSTNQYYAFAGNVGTSVGSATGYFAGKLDDIRIYWYPMTATQIKTIYNENAIRYGPVTGAP